MHDPNKWRVFLCYREYSTCVRTVIFYYNIIVVYVCVCVYLFARDLWWENALEKTQQRGGHANDVNNNIIYNYNKSYAAFHLSAAYLVFPFFENGKQK